MLSQSYKSPLNTSQNFKYFVYFWFFEEISHEAFGLLFHPEDVFYLFQGLYPYFLEYPDYSFLLYFPILVEHILQKLPKLGRNQDVLQ